MLEIKQYGLQRSGTNFLRVILQENYLVSVLSNEGGWKHGFYELPQRLGRELHCVLCVKNPYSWLVSFYNYRHPEKELSFEAFVRSPLTVQGPDGPAHEISSENPVRHWIRMHEHWLSAPLREHRLFVFRYEEIMGNPQESVKELVGALGLQRRLSWLYRLRRSLRLAPCEPPFFIPEVKFGALRDHYRKKNLLRGPAFDPNYYTRKDYLKAFTPGLLRTVDRQLEGDLLERLGYDQPGKTHANGN